MEGRKRPVIVLVAGIGSLLLGFCCCGQGGAMASMPVFFGWHRQMMRSIVEPERARLAAERRDLEARRAAATDQQEIAELDRKIVLVDQRMPPNLDSFYEALISPAASRCYYFEGAAGMITNLLILIAGIGLLMMKPWARPMAIYAAAGRIAAAIVYAVLYVTVVMPAMAEGMKKFQDSIASMPASAGQPQMPDMGAMMAVPGAIGAIVGLLLVIAWPAALLILLNTRAAREALVPPNEAGERRLGN